ncbi:Protein kinase-like domain [Pseudocohnilembus persalinus]|uniref:dual-specificity kinase n=1 Tax=Pseudocohnilembus persalinus TaxID=266149 RepID=A0A0V0QIF1_PSEPJ|nr:Protein kinase-like domain [Pseudocohnilembus persalinus]|eukprot:KRX02063.1 Protein kinase-like domain [Pseudocohnilembus persalinus]
MQDLKKLKKLQLQKQEERQKNLHGTQSGCACDDQKNDYQLSISHQNCCQNNQKDFIQRKTDPTSDKCYCFGDDISAIDSEEQKIWGIYYSSNYVSIKGCIKRSETASFKNNLPQLENGEKKCESGYKLCGNLICYKENENCPISQFQFFAAEDGYDFSSNSDYTTLTVNSNNIGFYKIIRNDESEDYANPAIEFIQYKLKNSGDTTCEDNYEFQESYYLENQQRSYNCSKSELKDDYYSETFLKMPVQDFFTVNDISDQDNLYTNLKNLPEFEDFSNNFNFEIFTKTQNFNQIFSNNCLEILSEYSNFQENLQEINDEHVKKIKIETQYLQFLTGLQNWISIFMIGILLMKSDNRLCLYITIIVIGLGKYIFYLTFYIHQLDAYKNHTNEVLEFISIAQEQNCGQQNQLEYIKIQIDEIRESIDQLISWFIVTMCISPEIFVFLATIFYPVYYFLYKSRKHQRLNEENLEALPQYDNENDNESNKNNNTRVIGFPKYSQSTKNSQINFKKQNYEQNTSLFSNQKKSINFKNPPTLENQQINDPKIFPKSCQNSQIIETNKNFSHLNPNPNPNPKASQPQPQPQSLNNTIQHPENLNETNIFSLKINDLTSSRNLVTQNKSKRNQLHFQNQQKSANILNATNFKSNLQQQFSKQTDTSIIHDKPETVDESFQSFSIKQEQEQHLKEQQEDCIFIQNSENFTQNNSSPLQQQIPHEQSQLHKQEATQLNWKEVSVPLMPEIVLKKYGYFLTDFEKKEIIAYKDVYFIGHQCNKKPKNLLITKNNYQYDNKEGDYLVQLKDHIAYRFEIIESLGQGSFGQVLKVFDHQKKEFAALKIIRNREKIYKQSIVELKILEFIKDFDTQQTSNIIKIKEYLYFRRSSCYESEKIYTYIQSRFYRAPEILLGVPYTKRIDMWSFGCIIAELYVGYPIFPGENEREQFEMFMELMGVPDDEYLLNCQRGRVFFNDDFTPKLTYNKIGIPVRKPGTKKVNQFLNTDDKDFIDFLKKCFTWKSEDRITPAQALVHEWILKGLPQEIKIQHLQQMSQQAPDLDLQILFKQYDIQNDSQKQQELHKQMQQEVLQSRYHQKDIEKQIKQVLQNSEKMQKMVLTIKEDKFQTNSNNSSNQNIQYQQQQNKNQVIQNTNTNSLITQKQQDKQMNNTNISFNQYLKNNNNSKKQNPNPITIPQYNNFSKKIQNQIKSLSQERQAQTGYKQQRKKENLVISTNISEQQFPSQTNQNQNQNQISFPNQNQFQNQNYNKNNLVTIYSAKNKNSFPNTKKSKFNSTFHNFPLSYQICPKQGFHSGETLSRVCLNEKCKDNALGCNVCFQEGHQDHPKKSLKTLIYKAKKALQNEETFIDENQFSNFIEQCQQKSRESFEKLQYEVVNAIQKIEKLHDKFYEDLLLKTKVKFPDQNTKNQILKIIDNISKNETSIQELNQVIQLILQVDPSLRGEKYELATFEQIKEKIEKTQQQQTKKTESLFQTIQKNLETFEASLKSQYQNQIEQEKIFNQSLLTYPFIYNGETKLIVHEDGIEYENNPDALQEQIIYSQETFESGQHGYQLQLVKFEPSSSLCFLIGVIEEDKLMGPNVSTTSGQPWSCLFNTCKGYMLPYDKHFGNVCDQGGILNIKLDIEQNTYTVTDAEEKVQYYLDTSQSYVLAGKKLKFFISFFSCELNARIRVLESY